MSYNLLNLHTPVDYFGNKNDMNSNKVFGSNTDNNNNNTWGTFASILQGIGSIGSGIQAYKSIPLMRRQLNEATALNRANFSQQANLINQQALQQHRQHLTSSGLDEEEFRKRYGGPVNLQTTY
jgi:hypothetical protein